MTSRSLLRRSLKGNWRGSISTARMRSGGPVVGCQGIWISGAITMGRGRSLAPVTSAGESGGTVDPCVGVG
jgi:hypothetical protein